MVEVIIGDVEDVGEGVERTKYTPPPPHVHSIIWKSDYKLQRC
jgi:hypothetical protein